MAISPVDTAGEQVEKLPIFLSVHWAKLYVGI